MMESMIAENEVTFKELEKNIYSWICEIGSQFTTEFLERYDRRAEKAAFYGRLLAETQECGVS